MPVVQDPEPVWRCAHCRDLRGWVEVESAEGATTTVKPCPVCNARTHDAWVAGKFRDKGHR